MNRHVLIDKQKKLPEPHGRSPFTFLRAETLTAANVQVSRPDNRYPAHNWARSCDDKARNHEDVCFVPRREECPVQPLIPQFSIEGFDRGVLQDFLADISGASCAARRHYRSILAMHSGL